LSSKAKKPQKVAAKKRRAEDEPKPMKEEVAQTKPEEIARPKGPAPHALVSSRLGGKMIERQGRGFSIGEMEGAELSPAKALGWHLSLDIRRRTVLDGNVLALKKWFVPPIVVAKPKPAASIKPATAPAPKPAKPEPHRAAKKEEPKKRAPRTKAAK
jgi:ribosomal protein L13E